MKNCPKCTSAVEDDALFCGSCGTALNGTADHQTAAQPVSYAPVDPFDHTAEFDPKDISDNKVVAMVIYLLGFVGIIIALLLSNSSKYVAFHVRQALKITVLSVLASLASVLLFWTFIVPFVCGIFAIALFIIKIICFVQICKGKAIEPAIVRDFGFLK
jgi:uncharacterized membrane protein